MIRTSVIAALTAAALVTVSATVRTIPSNTGGVSTVSVSNAASDRTYAASGRIAGQDRGRELAAIYCQTCHVLPEPDVLDQATWVSKVFPVMRRFMGLDQIVNREKLPHDLQALYPTFPTLTEDEWFAIATYYVERAPKVLPPASRPPITMDLTRFVADTTTVNIQPPLTIMVKFDPQRQLIMFGDGIGSRLIVTDAKGSEQAIVPLHGPPSYVAIDGDDWYVTDMGKLMPHDSAVGGLYSVRWNGTKTPQVTRILDSLRRPTNVNVIDLNGDGRKDFLICEFGNMIGRFGWYEVLPKGKTVYHELIGRPGAVRARVTDINGDKRPDILVQMAQAREGIFAFINKGKGRFEEKELLVFHPAFGSSYFDIVDYNDDGKPDIILANGDNGDYDAPPYKPYHGIRVFVNDGRMSFTERLFLPVNGAYGAVLRDFDGDGDKDIMSISYFADYRVDCRESLVYWERQADGSFRPQSLKEADLGRWIVMDCADMDGDGDDDIILGNASMGMGNVPKELGERWMQNAQAYLLLRNTTR